MKRLTALARYLLHKTHSPRELFDVFTDRGKTELLLNDKGNGLELARIKYTGIITIENYPYDAYALLAYVVTWLADNDPERQQLRLEEPNFDVEINNENTVNIELMIDFDEPLELIKDAHGAIELRAERYRIEAVDIDIAKNLDHLERKKDD